MNLLSVFQIAHSGKGRRVEFTLDSITIHDLHDNSLIFVGEENHQSCFYRFSQFLSKSKPCLLLMHVDDNSRLQDERFGHLNFKYMKQLSKQEMVASLPDIHFPKWVCQGFIFGKHPQEKFDKGRDWKASSPLELIHIDLTGCFPNLSIRKVRYVFSFIDDFSQNT